MSKRIARDSYVRIPVRFVSVFTAVALSAGLLMFAPPANATERKLVISSIKVATPAKSTGVVKAKVKVDAPTGSRLTYSVVNPDKGSASISSDGVLTYKPRAQARHRAAKDGAVVAERTDLVRVIVADSTGQRASRKFRLPILGANEAPVVSEVFVGLPDPQTGVVKGRVTFTDADGDTLTYRLTSDTSVSSAWQSIQINKVRARLHPAADVRGSFNRTLKLPLSNVTALPTDPPLPPPPPGYFLCPSSQGAMSMSADGSFTYTPTTPSAVATSQNTDTFVLTATDGYGGSTSVPVNVPVVG